MSSREGEPVFYECPDGMPADIWEEAYNVADTLSDLYCCDNYARYRIVTAFANALFKQREDWKDAVEEAAANGVSNNV